VRRLIHPLRNATLAASKKQESSSKKNPGQQIAESPGSLTGLLNGYCFICGLAVPAGLIFELLWVFADMYIFLWCFAA
jgi:hypothetical protein